MASRFMARRAAAGEIAQVQQLSMKISQMKDQARQLSTGITQMEDQLQQLSVGIAHLEDQAQRLSAGTVQPEDQAADSGFSGGFAGIGILAVVLLIAVIAGFLVSKLRPKAPGKRVGARVAGPVFTARDRALIDLLSEIVDIINSVEK